MKIIQWYVQFKMWTHFLNGIYSTIFFSLHVEFSILNAIANMNVISYSKIIEKWLRIFFNRKLSSSLSLSRQSEQTSTYNRLLQCTTPSLTWASSEKICRCHVKDSFLIPMPFVFSINWIIERNVFQSTFSCRHRKHCFDLNIDYIWW